MNNKNVPHRFMELGDVSAPEEFINPNEFMVKTDEDDAERNEKTPKNLHSSAERSRSKE